jgi:hypothetical protein
LEDHLAALMTAEHPVLENLYLNDSTLDAAALLKLLVLVPALRFLSLHRTPNLPNDVDDEEWHNIGLLKSLLLPAAPTEPVK